MLVPWTILRHTIYLSSAVNLGEKFLDRLIESYTVDIPVSYDLKLQGGRTKILYIQPSAFTSLKNKNLHPSIFISYWNSWFYFIHFMDKYLRIGVERIIERIDYFVPTSDFWFDLDLFTKNCRTLKSCAFTFAVFGKQFTITTAINNLKMTMHSL